MTALRPITVSTVLLLAVSGFAQPADVQWRAAVTRLIEQEMQRQKIPGLAIAVVSGDRIVWEQGFGVTDVTVPQPVTAHTLFSVQSISKTYTTVGFFRAADRWRIRLDDRLIKFYPAFTIHSRYGDDQRSRITFRQLLSHWAGLPHEAPLGNNYDDRYCTFDEHVASVHDAWLKAPVGSRYSYSNIGVDLAGYALERVARQPFAEYMKANVLVPLGMQRSTFSFAVATGDGDFARGHIDGKTVPVMRVPMLAAGGMYSTAHDLAQFIIAALRPEGSQGLPAAHLREMTTIQYRLPGQRAGYGLGVEVARVRSNTVLQHGGSGYGYSAIQAWAPQARAGVVVLSNAGDVGFPVTLAHDVLLQFAGKEEGRGAERQSRPFARQLLQTFAGKYKTYGRVVAVDVDGDRLT